MDYLLMTLFLIVCLLLIVVVLLQKGRGGGLGGAFGAGAGSSAFGTRTGDVFTWITIILTGAFLVLAIIGTVVARPDLGMVTPPELRPPAWPEGQDAKDVKVTISCGTKGATIRYTLNGKEPTEKSLPYDKSAIVVRRGQTLQAKSFRVGMASSPTVSVLYAPEAPKTQPTAELKALPTPMPTTLPIK